MQSKDAAAASGQRIGEISLQSAVQSLEGEVIELHKAIEAIALGKNKSQAQLLSLREGEKTLNIELQRLRAEEHNCLEQLASNAQRLASFKSGEGRAEGRHEVEALQAELRSVKALMPSTPLSRDRPQLDILRDAYAFCIQSADLSRKEAARLRPCEVLLASRAEDLEALRSHFDDLQVKAQGLRLDCSRFFEINNGLRSRLRHPEVPSTTMLEVAVRKKIAENKLLRAAVASKMADEQRQASPEASQIEPHQSIKLQGQSLIASSSRPGRPALQRGTESQQKALGRLRATQLRLEEQQAAGKEQRRQVLPLIRWADAATRAAAQADDATK